MKKPTVVIGAQWGDEGKGKIVDYLAGRHDCIIRFNGGNNAGHTIIHQGHTLKLHIIPSGVLHQKKLIITQGAVFDPEVFITELNTLHQLGIKPDLLIDYRVNLVLPYHRLLDAATEAWKGSRATGSLKLGIGYCYEDRNNRSGIRCEDLLYPKVISQKIATLFPLKKGITEKVFGQPVDTSAAKIINRLVKLTKIIKPFIGDASVYLSRNIDKKRVLFEGANGTMLDGNFGTYPYTVANNTISSAVFPYAGLPAQPTTIIGLVKAYTTRVGGGPFLTEQKNKVGEQLQRVGKEIGSTSGRVRRCGWLDLPQLQLSHRLNGFSYLVLTKIDVFSGLKTIKVCTHYRLNGKLISEFPSISHHLYRCTPVYQTLPGWRKSLRDIKQFAHLPREAQNYVRFVETKLNVPIKYISVGPERNDLIKRG